jgi:DNA-binding NtrC family response regulator
MKAHGAESRLFARGPEANAFVPASLVAALVSARWPGNIRQLRNFAEAFALANHRASEAELEAWIADNLPRACAPREETNPTRPASELSDDEIRKALRVTRYNITRAAELLHVSKGWLHLRIERSALLPRAKDLSEVEIDEALREAESDIGRAAELLHVSKHGLRLRMRALGLTSSASSRGVIAS